MIRGYYSAASGLMSQQTKLNAVANNVANINTTAYKPQDAEFSTLLYENINGGKANPIRVGHGVNVSKTAMNFAQGTTQQTGKPLDVLIEGNGFFAIEDKDNRTITYSRDGSFSAGMYRSDSYLVDGQGNFVLDSHKRRIEIDEKFDPKEIGVFSFDNNYGLQPVGGNKYIATAVSGNAKAIDEPRIQTGYLEGSAVKLAEEMVKMIEASKGFSFNSKVLQSADEMEKMTNQLR